MKTVIVNNKEYQIGAVYMDDDGEIGRLKSAAQGEECPFVLRFNDRNGIRTKPCNFLSAIEFPLGTIKDAPIELEEGEWYMTEINHVFFVEGGVYKNEAGGSPVATTNSYRPLYKMIKA